MSNLSNLTTRRLEQFRSNYQKQLDHKLSVAAKHQPGTAYHTRAMLEAETLRGRIHAIDQELERRA